MYLLVFVTLVISMIGVYVQVLTLQTAQIMKQQNGIAQAMMTWHSAAVSMASSIVKTNTAAYNAVATIGCSLTFNIPAGASYAKCPTPKNGATLLDAFGTVTDGAASPALNQIYNTVSSTVENVHLPASYDVKNYEFYSVLYQINSQNYVVTFLPAATAINQTAFLTMARGNVIGMTGSDLMQQFQHTNAPRYTYGTINASGNLITGAGSAAIQYTVPAFTNSNGAIAIVGTPN